MYVKLFRSILNSTIWMEENHVVRVWLTMLLLADSDGTVRVSIPGLAKEARVSIDECRTALDVLEAPDPESQSQIQEGRRAVRLGDEPIWFLVNYEHYRNMKNQETKREYMREYMREYRRKEKDAVKTKPNKLDTVNACKPPLGQEEGDGDVDGVHKEIKHIRASSDDDGECFSLWWAQYPKKIDKKKCERHFRRLSKTDKAAAAGPGYQAWIEHWKTIEPQFIPNPATWLNNQRWEADPPKSSNGKPKQPINPRNQELIDALRRRGDIK